MGRMLPNSEEKWMISSVLQKDIISTVLKFVIYFASIVMSTFCGDDDTPGNEDIPPQN